MICLLVGDAAVAEGFDRMNKESQASFSDIYNRYSNWFRARLVRRYGAQDAEDLLQETWVRLVPYQSTREIRHPQALLMRIASNLAADRTARRAHRSRHAAELNCSSGRWHESPAQTAELLAKQLVLSLPVPLRDVFVLSRFGGLTNCSARPGTWSRC